MTPVTSAPSTYYNFFKTTLKRSMTSKTQTTDIVLDPLLDNDKVKIIFGSSFEMILTFIQGEKQEIISAGGFTQDADGNITLVDVTRDLPWDGSSFSGGSNSVKFTAKATVQLGITPHSLNNVAFKNGTNTWTAKNTFNGGIQPPIFANNAARDVAFPTPWNGLLVVSGVQLQSYFNSTWNVLGTATVSSATESVEGTTELATLAEHDPATTGPRVVQAKNTRKNSTGAAEGQVVALNASAQVDSTLLPNIPVTKLNSGTSASSSTFWRGDGTWASPSTGIQTTILQGTRQWDAASSTQSIAHGLSGTPTMVMVTAMLASGGSGPAYMSQGSSNGTTNACTALIDTNSGGLTFAPANSGAAILIKDTTSSSPFEWTQSATITMDATNVNIIWTRTGTTMPSNTIHFTLTVFKL